jgi:phosphotriesterase-related protein
MSSTAGATAMTVAGPVSADALGRTLMHEHLFVDLSAWFVGSEAGSADVEQRVDMTMLGRRRRDAFSTTEDNLRLDDAGVAAAEVRRFALAGGSTIVDLSTPEVGRDPEALHRLSVDTGLHVVMGCGYFVESAHPPAVRRMSADDIAEALIKEITGGVGTTGIRPGIIGEIGTSGIDRQTGRKVGAVTKQEERVLRGGARAARETGLALSVAVDPRQQGGDEVLDIVESESLTPDRLILGHLDHVRDLNYHRRLADRGAVLQYDGFGREYYVEPDGAHWEDDDWRVRSLAKLIALGYRRQLLVSQDVCFKMDLRTYGGYGYDHVLVDVVPALLRSGVEAADVDDVLIQNPRRVLGIAGT